MKPYIYKEILAKHKFNSELKKLNYNFFNLLEDAVYEGLSASEFREKYDLPQIKYFKKTAIIDRDGFEHIVNDEAIIPYWEIHHYKNGFSDDAASIRINGTAGDRFNKNDQELHFYFTFKSLVPDFFYDTLPEFEKGKGANVKVYKDENGGFIIGFGNNKINKNLPSKQLNEGIQVMVLDDIEDNFNVLSDVMPGGMLSFLGGSDGFNVKDFKPSDLPQMLFITGTNHYIATTENVNSIVCLESSVSRTHFDDSDTGIVKLKGNLFVKHDCPLSVREIGKNTVLGEGTRVHYTASIGDNVATGYRALLFKDCEISDYSIICDRVQIYQAQKVPAFQIITARPASFLQKTGTADLSNFFHLSTKP